MQYPKSVRQWLLLHTINFKCTVYDVHYIYLILDKIVTTDVELPCESTNMFSDAFNAAIKDPVNNIKVKGIIAHCHCWGEDFTFV